MIVLQRVPTWLNIFLAMILFRDFIFVFHINSFVEYVTSSKFSAPLFYDCYYCPFSLLEKLFSPLLWFAKILPLLCGRFIVKLDKICPRLH